jgi:hypothetical protein
MLKRDLEAIWGENPQTVFILDEGNGYRRNWHATFVRIVKKSGSGYVLDYLTYRIRDAQPATWGIHRAHDNHATSCKRIGTNYPKYSGHTLESLQELLTAEAKAEWQREQEKLQVKPNAIAEIMSLTDLNERDLQQTPEKVLVALQTALKK